MKLDFYNQDDIIHIIQTNTSLLDIHMSAEAVAALSLRSRGTPRIANRLLKVVRDYHIIGKNISDIMVLESIFTDI